MHHTWIRKCQGKHLLKNGIQSLYVGSRGAMWFALQTSPLFPSLLPLLSLLQNSLAGLQQLLPHNCHVLFLCLPWFVIKSNFPFHLRREDFHVLPQSKEAPSSHRALQKKLLTAFALIWNWLLTCWFIINFIFLIFTTPRLEALWE